MMLGQGASSEGGAGGGVPSAAAAGISLRAPGLDDPDRLAAAVPVHHQRELGREIELGVALLVVAGATGPLAECAPREPGVAVLGAHAVAVLALDAHPVRRTDPVDATARPAIAPRRARRDRA